jgi:TrmH family RNA methyltransferase
MRIDVLLDRPFFPENVGSVARAMVNFGYEQLSITHHPWHKDDKARQLAVNALTILDNTVYYNTFEEAIATSKVKIATSSERQLDIPTVTPSELKQILARHQQPVTLVFGNEKNGLSNDQILQCQYLVTIPSTVGHSLNLSHAVTVLLYELSDLNQLPPLSPPLNSGRVLSKPFFENIPMDLCQDLLADAFKINDPKKPVKINSLIRLLSGLHITPVESQTIMGLLRNLKNRH